VGGRGYCRGDAGDEQGHHDDRRHDDHPCAAAPGRPPSRQPPAGAPLSPAPGGKEGEHRGEAGIGPAELALDLR
jgi:hypothetical protein